MLLFFEKSLYFMTYLRILVTALHNIQVCVCSSISGLIPTLKEFSVRKQKNSFNCTNKRVVQSKFGSFHTIQRCLMQHKN